MKAKKLLSPNPKWKKNKPNKEEAPSKTFKPKIKDALNAFNKSDL